MSTDDDDTLGQYVPALPRGARGKVTTSSSKAGIIVTASLSTNGASGAAHDPAPVGAQEPTRYSLALRRQASNRARMARGEPVLPAISAGSCPECEGWGVRGGTRQRCRTCGGRGE